MVLKAIIHEAEEGGFCAEVSALPGCLTQSDSVEEVTANLCEAIDGWLAVDLTEIPHQQGVRDIDPAV